MRTRNKHLIRNWIILICIILVIYFGAKAYYHHLLSPVSSSTGTQSFMVKKGEGISAVADQLEKQHLIRSALVFKVYAKLTGKGGNIIPGDFKISPSQDINSILESLSHGPEDISVTLLEGWRDEEMAAKLNSSLGISQGSFLKLAKQGYMFPDTYLFNKKATAVTVVQTLRDNFDQKYTPELQSRIQKLGLTPDQGVILASIVEREGRSDTVRTNIASILLKRLKIGMALDVDSTLQYALGYSQTEQSWWRSNLTADDKKIASPFNTYTNPGLPPTPICNPSLTSLTAVSNANPSIPYLYYYTDSKGGIWYAKTLDEQNNNVTNHP